MSTSSVNALNQLHSSDVVVFCCVTFETVRIVKPIRHLKADRVYIVNRMEKALGSHTTIYGQFYEEVVQQLKEDPGLEIGNDIIHLDVPPFRFKEVLAKLLPALESEKARGSQVYIAISGGAPEFAAAATIASMMVPGVIPFTVGVKEYTIPFSKLSDLYFIGGKPVGIARDVYDPLEFPTFHMGMPAEDLVRGLRILHELIEGKKLTTFANVIYQFKSSKYHDRIWTFKRAEKKPRVENGKVTQAEKMYYMRHFVEVWEKNGWIKRLDDRRGGASLTEQGKNVIEIFHRIEDAEPVLIVPDQR